MTDLSARDFPVFISYRVGEAADAAVTLKTELVGWGVPAFVAHVDLTQGENWVRLCLRTASTFVEPCQSDWSP